jgi:hypothetical protein
MGSSGALYAGSRKNDHLRFLGALAKTCLNIGFNWFGLQYLFARKLHTNMGMEFVLSNDGFAFYMVFGTPG